MQGVLDLFQFSPGLGVLKLKPPDAIHANTDVGQKRSPFEDDLLIQVLDESFQPEHVFTEEGEIDKAFTIHPLGDLIFFLHR